MIKDCNVAPKRPYPGNNLRQVASDTSNEVTEELHEEPNISAVSTNRFEPLLSIEEDDTNGLALSFL